MVEVSLIGSHGLVGIWRASQVSWSQDLKKNQFLLVCDEVNSLGKLSALPTMSQVPEVALSRSLGD